MISVVIPCYNAAATLKEAVDSALAQDVAKEIIIVDDGSTDASVAVIATFGERVRSVSTPNRGASAARNRGTELARGNFIQYLDSDDLLAPGTLAARRAALDATGANIAHADWQKLLQVADGCYAPCEVVRPDLAAIGRDAEIATATSAFWAPPAALLYRRTLVDRIGPWSPRLPVIQDARFLFDAAANGGRFVHVPGVGAHYRVSPSSLSRRNTERFVADCAVNAAEIEALWRSRGLLCEERRLAVASMWWYVAHASLLNGLEQFELARASYNAVASRRAELEFGQVLRWMIGPRRSVPALNAVRHARKLTRLGQWARQSVEAR